MVINKQAYQIVKAKNIKKLHSLYLLIFSHPVNILLFYLRAFAAYKKFLLLKTWSYLY